MNISLTPELEKYINNQVKSGLYHSSSEVVRAALRLFVKAQKQQDGIGFESYKMWLNQEVHSGLDQAEQGKTISSDELKSHIIQKRKNFTYKNQNNR